MNATVPGGAARATALTVRACCLILHDGHLALIHRQRPDGDQYSVPGGLVHADEEVTAALARELDEELGLDVAALPYPAELRWVQDQITTRPGGTAPFRRLHLIHVLPDLPTHARQAIAATEQDAEDHARITWTPIDQAARLHLYPAVGEAIKQGTGRHTEPGRPGASAADHGLELPLALAAGEVGQVKPSSARRGRSPAAPWSTARTRGARRSGGKGGDRPGAPTRPAARGGLDPVPGRWQAGPGVPCQVIVLNSQRLFSRVRWVAGGGGLRPCASGDSR